MCACRSVDIHAYIGGLQRLNTQRYCVRNCALRGLAHRNFSSQMLTIRALYDAFEIVISRIVTFLKSYRNCLVSLDLRSSFEIVTPEAIVFFCSRIEELPISAQTSVRATRRESVLARVLKYTLTGWPSHVTDEELKPYFNRKHELSTEQCYLRVSPAKSSQLRLSPEKSSTHTSVQRERRYPERIRKPPRRLALSGRE